MTQYPEWVSGNIFIRPNHLDRVGDRVDGHTHTFDHTTIIWRGRVHVKATRQDGTLVAEKDFEAGQHCLIKADICHEITALEDNTVFWCVYAHRDPQGRVVQEFTGWPDAYR